MYTPVANINSEIYTIKNHFIFFYPVQRRETNLNFTGSNDRINTIYQFIKTFLDKKKKKKKKKCLCLRNVEPLSLLYRFLFLLCLRACMSACNGERMSISHTIVQTFEMVMLILYVLVITMYTYMLL